MNTLLKHLFYRPYLLSLHSVILRAVCPFFLMFWNSFLVARMYRKKVVSHISLVMRWYLAARSKFLIIPFQRKRHGCIVVHKKRSPFPAQALSCEDAALFQSQCCVVSLCTMELNMSSVFQLTMFCSFWTQSMPVFMGLGGKVFQTKHLGYLSEIRVSDVVFKGKVDNFQMVRPETGREDF